MKNIVTIDAPNGIIKTMTWKDINKDPGRRMFAIFQEGDDDNIRLCPIDVGTINIVL